MRDSCRVVAAGIVLELGLVPIAKVDLDLRPSIGTAPGSNISIEGEIDTAQTLAADVFASNDLCGESVDRRARGILVARFDINNPHGIPTTGILQPRQVGCNRSSSRIKEKALTVW